MSGLSNYIASKLVDHSDGKAAFTMPTELWVGFLTTASTASTPGTEVTTGTVPSYARVGLVVASIGAAVAGSATNTAAFTGTTATAGGTAPLVSYWGIYDAPSAGNQLFFGTLATPFNYGQGVQPFIDIGQLVIALS